MKNTVENLTRFISDYISASHSQGVVVGMSGEKIVWLWQNFAHLHLERKMCLG